MTIFNIKSPTVSFLFLEVLGDLIKENPEIAVAEIIGRAYKSVAGKPMSEEETLTVIGRLRRREEEIAKSSHGEGEGVTRKKKSMGSSEMDWVGELPPDKLCLYLADYDFIKAKHLYCEVDFEAVIMAGEVKQQSRWNELTTNFETSMYAFGGSYKGDNGTSGGSEIDATLGEDGKISADAEAAIKSMGF